MCGIIGFADGLSAVPVLLDGLERLEYCGYDSAGVAVISPDGRLQVEKSKGRLSALRERLSETPPIVGSVGVGRTRWATHGEPGDVNAHPHVGGSGRIAVVHNGIIENYLELKAFLSRRGVAFRSETDTEIVAQLIDYYYAESRDVMNAVCAATHASAEPTPSACSAPTARSSSSPRAVTLCSSSATARAQIT